ncbi:MULTISPECIES: LipL32 family surface lipoprotein [Pseudoalteromonas]|uniref:LipL32 family surface lipoprotein n=1 Tax=Pseudoalteromonas TaxID=53246 RepID=UPI0015830D9B|nr:MULTISPECIES: LipL32 family surface lipoprotein [Pseudoalteromonas]MDI4651768.1 Lipl32 family lipoprotein [Pseudoalteromonas shioyasakiensis]NUJ38097.1 hypothetical protein [Pseudoalteromonas sp. 0303]
MDIKMKRYLLFSSLFFSSFTQAGFLNSLVDGDGLPTLTSSKKAGVGFASVAAPYANTVNYFGYIDKTVAPDANVNGKKAYYLYVWVPAAIDELGVRMISPVGDLAEPSKTDFVQKGYTEKAKDKETWFDTWIRVERMDVVSADKIRHAKKVINILAKDDDGDDTYDEKRHASYNSLVRIETEVSKPEKALVRGLYRIAFTTYKKGEVEGSFVSTVGTNVPGVKVAASLAELDVLVNN